MAPLGDSEPERVEQDLEQFAFQQQPQCWWCYWYVGGMRCRAFDPTPIPVDIMSGGIEHTKPIEGDNGRQFVNKFWVREGKIPPPEDW